jgi:hypothetical protein
MRLFSIVMAVLVVAAAASEVQAQTVERERVPATAKGTLKGRVLPTAISATVEISAIGLVPTGLPRSFVIRPGADGRFAKALRPGVYQLSVSAERYVPLFRSVLRPGSTDFDVKDIGLPVVSNKDTDVGDLILQQGGSIEGIITSDDPKDLIGVWAFRRTEDDELAYDLATSWNECIADPRQGGKYRVFCLQPGTYDLSIASRRYGIKCFIPGYGPTVKSGSLVSELEERLNAFGRAKCSNNIEKELSFYSDTNKTRYAGIRQMALMIRKSRATHEKEMVTRKYHVLSCSSAGDRAVTLCSLTSEAKHKATGKLDNALVEKAIYFWSRDQGVWKISCFSWIPLREASGYLSIHDFLNPSGRDPLSGPPNLGQPSVIFGSQLAGYEVKAGAVTTVPTCTVGKAGVRMADR